MMNKKLIQWLYGSIKGKLFWLILTLLVLYASNVLLLHSFDVDILHNRRKSYVYNPDSLFFPLIITDTFQNMKLYKKQGHKFRDVMYTPPNNNELLPSSHTSGYIIDSYASIPDTIYATGYYVKTLADLQMIVEYSGRNIRILSYYYYKPIF